MKKLYLPYLLLFMPVFMFAQGQSPMLNDVWKKVHGIASSFKFNDHLGIIQVTLTDTSFELMAVDNKMSVLWRDSLKGCGVACGKFKDKILAISDSGYSNKKRIINPYYAFLIDPASGKIILQNKIFEQKAKHQEEAISFFAAGGSDFNLAVRQADISYSWLSPYKNKTENLALINLNEKLEPTYLKPKVPDEGYVSMAMNSSGDLFLLTIRDQKSLQVRRYDHGSIEPSAPITQACDNVDKVDLLGAADDIAPSEADRNILYLSIGHTNKDDDREIITAKFNFATRLAQATTQVFTHKHVKEVEKSYVPVNNDFPAANLGSAKKQMRVDYVAEQNGKLITVSAEIYSVALNNVQTFYGGGLVISCYDSDLKQLFQQVMPVSYSREIPLTTGYALGTNQLKIVSNSGYASTFGQLDLSTGKWLKLAWIKADAHDSDKHVIWFTDTFIVPYVHPRAFGSKYNIDLVLADY
jgi:hypothetical protein